MTTTPDPYETRARLLRALAQAHRVRAAALDAEAEAVLATRSMRVLADVITEAEARDIAEHPDLAELNVQLDNRYEPPRA